MQVRLGDAVARDFFKLSRALANSERGSVAVLGAILITLVIGCTAMAVDLGSLSGERRSLQSATDAAAMAAVIPLEQNQVVNTPPDTSRLYAIVVDALAGNHYPNAIVDSVVAGTFCPDPTLAPAARFTPGSASCASGVYNGPVPNAVRATSHVQSPFYLAKAIMQGQSGQTVSVTATAAGLDEAGFSIGTGLVSVNSAESPVLNAVLGGMLGTSLSLSAVSYEGLANTQINALDFLSALASNATVNVATVGGLANASASLGTVLQVEAAVLKAEGAPSATLTAALAGLQALSANIYGQPTVQIGQLLNVAAWQTSNAGGVAAPTALQATVNAMQIATAAIELAQNGQTATIPTSGLSLAGLGSLTVSATVGSPMQNIYPGSGDGYIGAAAETAQVNMNVGLDPPPISIGLPSVAAIQMSLALPVSVHVASGTAYLSTIACGGNPATDANVTVTGASSIATLNATLSAHVAVQLLGATVLGTTIEIPLNVQVGAGGPTALIFTQADIQSGALKRIASEDVLSTTTSSLMSTLSSQMGAKINLQLASLNLPALTSLTPLLTPALAAALTPLAATLDAVIDDATAALGVQVGYMDVMGTGVRCGVPAIVN